MKLIDMFKTDIGMLVAIWAHPHTFMIWMQDEDFVKEFERMLADDPIVEKFGVTIPPSELIGKVLDTYIFIYDGTSLWGG